MHKIVLEYIYPPIPDRRFDWRAHLEDSEKGLYGWGKTKYEAIKELIQQIDTK